MHLIEHQNLVHKKLLSISKNTILTNFDIFNFFVRPCIPILNFRHDIYNKKYHFVDVKTYIGTIFALCNETRLKNIVLKILACRP